MISITQDNIYQAIGNYITSVLPGFVFVVGQINRVPEVTQADFGVIWPLMRTRLATNGTDYEDVYFTGSISGPTLTVSQFYWGSLIVGSVLFGAATGTTVTGLNLDGTYTVTPSQNVASTQMAAGNRQDTQPTRMTLQLDVHGPNSAENAQVITTAMWSDMANDSLNPVGISGLYCSDPRETTFLNGEQQQEQRWSIDIELQANPTLITPLQYFDHITGNTITLYPVE